MQIDFNINQYPCIVSNVPYLLSDKLRPRIETLPAPAVPQPDLFEPGFGVQQEFDFADDLPEAPPSLRFYGTIWPDYRHALIRHWYAIHADIRDFLIRRDIAVHLHNNLRSSFPLMTDKASCLAGFFDRRTNQIMLAQSLEWFAGVFLPADDIALVLLHEIGHAIDRNLSDMSDRGGFAKAYDKDFATIHEGAPPESLKNYISAIGRSETFAQIWAQQGLLALGERGAGFDEHFCSWFPESSAWIKANVPSAAAGFDLPAKTLCRPDEAGLTPLENIGTAIDIENLRDLLRQGADPLRLDIYKKTPLDHAMLLDKPVYVMEILRFLIEHPGEISDGNAYGLITRARRYVERSVPEGEEKDYVRNWLGILETPQQ